MDLRRCSPEILYPTLAERTAARGWGTRVDLPKPSPLFSRQGREARTTRKWPNQQSDFAVSTRLYVANTASSKHAKITFSSAGLTSSAATVSRTAITTAFSIG